MLFLIIILSSIHYNIIIKTTNRRRGLHKSFFSFDQRDYGFLPSSWLAQVEDQRRKKILVVVDGGEESMYALSWCLNNMVSKEPLILLCVKSPPAVYAGMDGTGYLFSSEIIAATERYSKGVGDSVMEKAERLCAEFDHARRSLSCYDETGWLLLLYDGNNFWNYGQVVVEKRVESGYARDVICQMTQKLGVDLLVMGSHGYGMIKSAFLGSVSNHCAQTVKCPVMIVKRLKSAS